MSTAYAPRINTTLNSGDLFGNDLQEYERKSIETQVHASEPISLGGWKNFLLNEAIEIKNDCSELGWDGYEANPISEEALQRAKILIEALPDNSPWPELVPSAEGEIAYEWNLGPSRILSVTPYPHLLVWAASLGSNSTRCGKMPFHILDPWPRDVLLILSFYSQDD
ncbi:MAG: hypothetical protein KC592_12650 [Nitrospira sp.]|nr:hypothetical protein [Nitrospira sp.]